MNDPPDSPLFTHPGDLTEPIFGVVPLAFAAVAIAICLYGLVRGRLGSTSLTAGIVTVPLIAFALGNAVLIDRSKETEFCGSCHVMEPVLESVYADDGSLASFHVANGAVPTSQSCYTCHSGYGLSGDTQAKTAGLRHMLHTALGDIDYPLAIHGSYDIDSCLACHAESKGFRGVEVHATPEIQQALLSGEMTCAGMCHPPAHPAEALAAEALAGNGSSP